MINTDYINRVSSFFIIHNVILSDTLKVRLISDTTRYYGFSFSEILSIFAIIVSFFGVFFAVFYNRKTYEMNHSHYRMVTRPNIDFNYNFERVSGDRGRECLVLKNAGLGPAILKKMSFHAFGVSFDKIIDLYKKYYPLLYNNIAFLESNEFLLGAEYSMSPHDELSIFNIKYHSVPDAKYLNDALKEIKISIDYVGLYDENAILLNRSIKS
jgi:hypothetical protein